MRQLTPEFFKRWQGLSRNNTLYVLKNDKLSRWSKVQHFRFTVPALPLVFATVADGTTHFVEIERPPASRAETDEVHDEGNVVHSEASSEIELCLKKGQSLVYEGGEPPIPEVKEGRSEKRNLLSSMILVGKKNRKTATRRERGEKDGVWGAETEKVGIEVSEEEVTVGCRKVETNYIKEAET